MSKRQELILDNLFGRSLFDTPLFGDFGFNEILPSMRMDIKVTDTDYVIIADVPGIPKENINIDIEEGYLTIATKAAKENNENNGKWVRRERFTSSQTQKIYVGDVKEEDIKAAVKDGVLTITIPKMEEKKPEKKTINID